MKKITVFLFVLFLFNNSFAQSTSKEQKAKELLELTGTGKMGVQMAQQVLSSFRKSFTQVPDEFWNKVSEAISADELVNMLIPVYSKYYTEEDIDQLIAFYKTPIGQKVITTTPKIMEESMLLGKEWGKEITKKIFDELEKGGYKHEN